MKRKLLIVYVAILLVASCVTVSAETEYEIDLKEDDRLIYRLVSWDKDLADENLGSDDPEDELGAKAVLDSFYMYEIDDIDEVNDLWSWEDYDYVSGWEIELDFWGWTDDKEDFEAEHDANIQLKIFDDTDDYGPYQNLLFVSIIIPTPSEEYLGSLKWDSEYDQVELKVTNDYTTSEGKDVKDVREWDKDGVLYSITLMTDNDEVIYEIVRDKSDPVVFVVITIAVIGFSIFGIIYALYTKTKKKRMAIA